MTDEARDVLARRLREIDQANLGSVASQSLAQGMIDKGLIIVPAEPTEAMIGRVARAICVSEGEDPDKPIKSGQDGMGGMVTIYWQYYKCQAEAAIAAMKGQTDES